jgi:hypothetical protein
VQTSGSETTCGGLSSIRSTYSLDAELQFGSSRQTCGGSRGLHELQSVLVVWWSSCWVSVYWTFPPLQGRVEDIRSYFVAISNVMLSYLPFRFSVAKPLSTGCGVPYQ